MKAEIKQKWITALLGGEYQQNRKCLHDQDGYCCLGVLCSLHSKETNTAWDGGESEGEPILYLGMEGALPEEVAAWAGLSEEDPVVEATTDNPTYKNRYGHKFSLSELNDDLGWSFKEIAEKAIPQL